MQRLGGQQGPYVPTQWDALQEQGAHLERSLLRGTWIKLKRRRIKFRQPNACRLRAFLR